MSKYLNSLDDFNKEYMHILSDDYPDWLDDYINTPEMMRLKKISNACGTDYLNIYPDHEFYSVLDHSVGCALIVWHFTHDKKQTLASLFHDISTPTFKHCIDFLYGDYLYQEKTEDKTTDVIRNSKEIMALLKKDNLHLEDVNDYHKYPICDNDTPRLSSDRLEYTFKDGLLMHYNIDLTLDEIKKYYDNLVITLNELGEEELAFKDKMVAEEFISKVSLMWPVWCDNRNNLCFNFYADVIKRLVELEEITIDDLYYLTEKEVMDKVNISKDERLKVAFNKFLNNKEYYESDEAGDSDNCYLISLKSKKRYLDPLVVINNKGVRLSKVSDKVANIINDFLKLEFPKYAWFPFAY